VPGQGRLGDKANVARDVHGCPACPHPAIGPAIQGSPDVNVNRRPALRVGDRGLHAACCGANTWTAVTGSQTVLINGKSAHRMGDQSRHCGGSGTLIEGSPNVIVGESSGGGARQGEPPRSTSAGSGAGASSSEATSAVATRSPSRGASAPAAASSAAPGVAVPPATSASGSEAEGTGATQSPSRDATAPAADPTSAPADEPTWLEIVLVDEDGKGMAAERYVVTLPGGTSRTGFLDDDGCTRLDDLSPGICQVSFPDLDEEAWQPADG
jgi:uncharacterized Zn-binding protein involved in type VI secretion